MKLFSRFPGKYPALFQATPGRFYDASLMTIISVFAVLLGNMFHQPMLDLYPVLLMAVWKSSRLGLIITAVIFASAMTIMVIAVFIGLYVEMNSNLMKFMVIAIYTFMAFLLSVGTKFGPMATILGLMISYMLLSTEEVTNGQMIVHVVLDLYLVTLVSSLFMVIGALTLAKAPQKSLCLQISWRLRLAADLLSGSKQEGLLAESDRVLAEGAVPLLTDVALASKEGLLDKGILNRLRQSSLNAFGVLALSRLCARDYGMEYLSKSGLAKKIAQVIEEMASVFEKGEIAGIDEKKVFETSERDDKNQTALMRIKEMLVHFSDQSQVVLPSPPKAGMFLPNVWSIDNVHYALKGTLAVTLCICFYLALDWNAVHTCVLTCFLVGLPTVGEMIDKQMQRIGGALVGAVLTMFGMVCILTYFTNVAQLVVLLLICLGIAAWIKAGPEKTSYAGFQIAVILCLSDLAQSKPTFDLTVPRDRIIGIFIGLVFSYVIFTRIWPVSSSTRLPALFNKAFGALKSQSVAEDSLSKIFWASGAQASLSGAQRMLECTRKEPPLVRPSDKVLNDYQRSLYLSRELIEILLLPNNSYTHEQAKHRLDRLKEFLEDAGVSNLMAVTETLKKPQEPGVAAS